jgi:hypothetical protein
MRGRLASALLNELYTDVFIGRIEGEYAVELPHPDAGPDSPPGIMTWCQLRVLRPVRGALVEDQLVTALYDGGALGPDHFVWVSHAPRCLPGDEGIFTLYEHRSYPGLLRPSYGATVSYLTFGGTWQEHPLTAELERLAHEAGVRP